LVFLVLEWPPSLLVLDFGLEKRAKFGSVETYISKWWYAGEDGATDVYRQQFAIPALTVVAVAILFVAKWSVWPHGVMKVMLFLFAVDSGISLRRALILSGDSIIYRPPLGRIVVVPFAAITKIEYGNAFSGTTVIQRPDKGMRITAGNRVENFPLSVNNSVVLLDKIERHTNLKWCVDGR
jgi:hypothetical protein